MTPLVTPIVNNNGTSKQALIAELIQILQHLDKLIPAMQSATPHGRDYQISPAGDYRRAADAWSERINTVATLRFEIEELAKAVNDQSGR